MSENLYQYVNDNDYKEDGPRGIIQWQGTDVCIDLYCKCGHIGHVDAELFYYYKCCKCGAKYAVGSNIKLIELDEEQSKEVDGIGSILIGFITCD